MTHQPETTSPPPVTAEALGWLQVDLEDSIETMHRALAQVIELKREAPAS